MNHDIVSRFHAIAGQFPDQVAISWDDDTGRLTYTQLQQRSRQIAAALASEHGVVAGDRVGIFEAARPDVIAAMLAVATLGAAYVPIDPELPASRITALVDDAELKVCLAIGAAPGCWLDTDPQVTTLAIRQLGQALAPTPDADPPVPAGDAALYVMYTSGSTGTPKGVVVPHRAVYRLAVDPDFIAPGPQLRFLQMAPQSFDASTLEIWGPLLNGGTCVLYPERMPDPGVLERLVKNSRVNTVWLTAALFNRFVTQWPQAISGIQSLLFGGERASLPHVQAAFEARPQRVLINGYGPTENTTFTTCHRVTAADFDAGQTELPIGKPISGTTVRVVDENLADVATGAQGELLAGGAGLALGYLNRPELNQARFVQAADGQRWYRTGDLVSRGTDGVIRYHGRIDRQMKLDGHRIEPGEVEVAILRDPALRQAHVTLREGPGGNRKLVAYLVGAMVEQDLKTRLAGLLPNYMVPSVFVALEELPTNVNGKVDAARLPDPFLAAQAPGQESGAGDSLEDKIAQIWCQCVAGMLPPEVNDNFFDAGGRSLDMLTVKQKLDALLGRNIAVVTLFQYPTIEKLAAYLTAGNDANQGHKAATEQRAGQRRKMLQQRRARRSADG